MKHIIIVTILILMFAISTYASTPVSLDWGEGQIISIGEASYLESPPKENGIAGAKQLAKASALRNLAEAIYALNTNLAGRKVSDVIQTDEKASKQLDNFLKQVNVKEFIFEKDLKVVVKMTAALYGRNGLGAALVPYSIIK